MPAEISSSSIKALLSQSLEHSFSPVVIQLMQKAVQENVEISEISKLIALEPLLAAAVIGIANSPHYGYGKSVNSIDRAIVIMGLREILKLAVSISIKKNLSQKMGTQQGDVAQDWRMTIWSAVAAEHIAKCLGGIPPGKAYLAAILKDIPLILINQTIPLPSRGSDSLIDYSPEQYQAEINTWGMSHQEMSQFMGEAWGLSKDMTQAMAQHHTPIVSISKNDPLSLSLALATRWSELLQGKRTNPEEIFNFEFLLRTSLGLDENSELEQLRLSVLKDFKDILIQLDISEVSSNKGLYETSLSSLKNYYFMALDLADTANDLPSLAKALGSHLSMFWQIPSWDLALRLPNNNQYQFFSCEEGDITQSTPQPLARWAAKNAKKLSVPFISKGKLLAELLLPKQLLMAEKLQAFNAYASFVNQSLRNYYESRLIAATQASMLDELPIGVASVNFEGILINANRQFCSLFNLDEICSDVVPELLEKYFKADIQEDWASIVERASTKNINFLLSPRESNDDNPLVYLATFRQWQAENDPKLLLFIQSINEISSLEAQALKQRDFLEYLFSSMQDIVLTVDGQGVISWAAPSLKDLVGKDFFSISRAANPHFDWSPQILSNGSCIKYPLEAGLKIPGQRLGLFEFLFSPLGGNKFSEYLVVGRDLTNIRRLEAKVKQQAIRDGLTRLFNHSYFHGLLETEIAKYSAESTSNIGLLFMDLDGFKKVNDTAGHLAGDNILKIVGSILQENLRQGRDFPARYGGDEFAVLATDVNAELLEKIAQRVLQKVLEQTQNEVGLSIGIVMLKAGEEDGSELLRRADKALYASKSKGGNQVSWG